VKNDEYPTSKEILISDFADYDILKLTTPIQNNEKLENIRQKVFNYISNRHMPDISMEKLYFTFSYQETANKIQKSMG